MQLCSVSHSFIVMLSVVAPFLPKVGKLCIQYRNKLVQTSQYEEVNCTEPVVSPSVSVSRLNSTGLVMFIIPEIYFGAVLKKL